MTKTTYKHWHINKDAENIVWLHLDMEKSRVNLLSGSVIEELDQILDHLLADTPQGVVILSDKKDSFIFGADIKEFTTLENDEQALAFLQRGHALMNKLETLPCPTVSMIHGFCLGGGMELSLACNYIVVSDDNITRVGLPEIKLGIHPGYGGTYRSINRTGPLPAMDMMLTGRALPARTAKRIGLVDEMVPERQLKKAARRLALNAPMNKRPSFVPRLLNSKLIRPLVAKKMRAQVTRKAKIEHYPAPYNLINLWEKYADNKKRMLEEEAKGVAHLATTDTARNLVRVFFLQEDLKNHGKKTKYTPQHVHVIGGGIMGGDIASWCAIQGYTVTVQDQQPEALAKTIQRAAVSFRKKYKRNRRAIREANDRLMPDHKGLGVSKADIVIEAIFEDIEVKRNLYQKIEPNMKADAILATNTSSIMLEDLSSSLKNPGRLVGLHFFNPVAMMPLVEVIRGKSTDEAVMQQALAFAKNIGKLPLPVKSSPGFLVNRILMPYLIEAVTMVGEGIAPEVIDKAATGFGMPMGPVELADTVGLDVCRFVATILSKELGLELPDKLDAMVSSNNLGKKTGAGFYQYNKGKPIKNKNTHYSDMQTVEDRLIMRLLNESMACLREGIVENEDMIDAGVIFGTGFAPFRGGPVQHIHTIGVDRLSDRIDHLKDKYGDRFTIDTAWSSL